MNEARTLRAVSWFVFIVGVVAGAVAVFLGFNAAEPWSFAGSAVTEGWQSAGIGLLAGAVIIAASLTACISIDSRRVL